MEFSWAAAGATMLVTLIEAGFSISEGTFSRRQHAQVNLSFLWHWGTSIGDLFILPIVNGLVVPHLTFTWRSAAIALASIIITCKCHKSWWPDPKNWLAQGFILRSSPGSIKIAWTDNLTKAGTIHFLFMTFQLIILGEYIITPMPAMVVKWVSLLFIVFVPVAIIEPGIIQTGGWKRVTQKDWVITAGTTAIACSLIALTWYLKT